MQRVTVALLMTAVALVLLSQAMKGAAAVLWLGSLACLVAALVVAVTHVRKTKHRLRRPG